jgi:hypothetical protein
VRLGGLRQVPVPGTTGRSRWGSAGGRLHPDAAVRTSALDVDTPADPSAGVLAVQGPFRRAARGNGLHRCGRGRPHRGRPRVRQVDDGAAGIGAARRARVQTPITEVCTRIAREAVPVNRMLFLKPGAPASRISRQSRSEALRELLAHHREAGSSIGDAMQTLLHLASRTESWSIEFPEHHALVDLVCDFIDA